jgi:hypothetical protein
MSVAFPRFPTFALEGNLVFIIVNRNAIVALDSALACCHFCALWVGDMTFNRLTYTTYFILVF